MVSDLLFSALVLFALLWLCVILYDMWPYGRTTTCPTTPMPAQKRLREPKPYPGLTDKPHCAACVQAVQAPTVQPPPAPPLQITSTRGRRRQVDTSAQFCPSPHCQYQGWVGRGNIRAN